MSDFTTRASLLARLTSGDDELAWHEFHLQYAGLITRIAARHGLQQADCEDIVQNVMMSLVKSMPGFEYDQAKGRFRGYLKTAVIHEIVRRFRQTKGRGEVSVSGDDDSSWKSESEADRIWDQEWRTYHVERAMRTIEAEFTEKDRQAFMQYAMEGRGVEETAASTQMSVAAVYQAKSRILRRLSELVAVQIKEEG